MDISDEGVRQGTTGEPEREEEPSRTGTGTAREATPDGIASSTVSSGAYRPSSLTQDRTTIVQKGTEQPDARVRVRGDGRPRRTAADRAAAVAGLRTVIPGEQAPTLLLVSGSPRKRACVSLVDLIEQGAKESGARTQRFLLSEKHINPCIGCNACCKTGACVYAARLGERGGFSDDYLEFTRMLDGCDGLVIVAPVYFAGPSAQLKAVYDRFQPYWARKYVLGQPFPERRPSQLFVVGSGGDPHGNEPLVAISKSALQIAGFELEKVNNFVGYLAPKDVPAMPSEPELSRMSMRERSLLKQAIDRQDEFRVRAVEAGRAFARSLRKDTEIIIADPVLEEPDEEGVEKRFGLRSTLEKAADEYGNSSALLSSLLSTQEGSDEE